MRLKAESLYVELELLGEQFRIVLQQAKKHKTIYCKHSLQQSVDQCILSQIGTANEKHYFVCTQDLVLRRKLREFENVPIVYFGPDQRVTIEDIHKTTLKNIEKEAYQKLLPKGQEVAQVQQFKKEQQALEKQRRIKELSSQQGIKIKTKIAKGPNPLSIKKKQDKTPNQQQIKNQPQIEDSEGPAKRKRIRKRNRNKKEKVISQQQ